MARRFFRLTLHPVVGPSFCLVRSDCVLFSSEEAPQKVQAGRLLQFLGPTLKCTEHLGASGGLLWGLACIQG